MPLAPEPAVPEVPAAEPTVPAAPLVPAVEPGAAAPVLLEPPLEQS